MSEKSDTQCCGGEMEFINATPSGDARFRCPECLSRVVVPSNLCPVCTEPRDECVCAEMGYKE